MQMNRLFEIVYLLLEKKKVTAGELAQRFEVSERTIYRDIDTLSSAGIPVYATKGKGGGIQLLEDFVLNKSVLSEQEQNDILFSLKSLSAAEYPEADSVLHKLSGLFRKNSADWIDVDFSEWGSGAGEKEKFSCLKTAILNCRLIYFVYYNSMGETAVRTVEPVKLGFKAKSWYLQGYCRTKQAFRTFKLSRISQLSLTDETFLPRNEVPKLDFPSGPSANMVTVKLRIAPEAAYRVFDEFFPNQVTKQEDGSFLAEFTCSYDEWVYGYILTFGASAEVLEPAFLREELQDRLRQISNIYQ